MLTSFVSVNFIVNVCMHINMYALIFGEPVVKHSPEYWIHCSQLLTFDSEDSLRWQARSCSLSGTNL